MSGTLRSNLDMFGEHDDAELHAALRASGLYALSEDATASPPEGTSENAAGASSSQTTGNAASITLDSPIASGGTNLSQGQRQIIGALSSRAAFSMLMWCSARTGDGTPEQAARSRRSDVRNRQVVLLTERADRR
jgi:hypothetical protein